MPRKAIKHLTPEQLLNKIRISARDAARFGQTCHDKETLKVKRGYTDKQADAYITAFNEAAGTPQEQAIRKARRDAQKAVARGASCPTKEALLEKGYTKQTVKAYLAAYQESKGADEEQAIKRARCTAQMAAGHGTPCPSKETLLERGYTEQASDAYLAAYKESKENDTKQEIRKARNAAQTAAACGTPCLTKDALLEKYYTEQAAEAYLAAYEATKGTEEKQMIRRARNAAKIAAAQGTPCSTKEALLEKGYTEQASEAYLVAYEESKGTDEEQAIRKARKAAQIAAAIGTRCPTKEALIKKGYTEQESEAYLTTYEKSKNAKKIKLTREQELQQLQKLLNQSSEANDDSCIASFLDSLGYQESTPLSLTEQEEEYLAEILGEESTNSNNLFFNFNSADTTSLTTSDFLSLFEEENDQRNAVTVVHPSQVLR